MSNIIRNAIKTPDGTVLESRHVHDYKSHVDVVSGKTYMVDGGLDYVRRSAVDDQVDLCVYSDSPHDEIREALTWGTYGKDGDQELSYVKLKDMSIDHIQAVLDNVKGIYPQYKEAMENELNYRSERNGVTSATHE